MSDNILTVRQVQNVVLKWFYHKGKQNKVKLVFLVFITNQIDHGALCCILIEVTLFFFWIIFCKISKKGKDILMALMSLICKNLHFTA